MESFFKHYTQDLFQAISSLDWRVLKSMADRLMELKKHNCTVYLIGNGGSSATPSHSAGDWTKELRIKTICLSDTLVIEHEIPEISTIKSDVNDLGKPVPLIVREVPPFDFP